MYSHLHRVHLISDHKIQKKKMKIKRNATEKKALSAPPDLLLFFKKQIIM